MAELPVWKLETRAEFLCVAYTRQNAPFAGQLHKMCEFIRG